MRVLDENQKPRETILPKQLEFSNQFRLKVPVCGCIFRMRGLAAQKKMFAVQGSETRTVFFGASWQILKICTFGVTGPSDMRAAPKITSLVLVWGLQITPTFTKLRGLGRSVGLRNCQSVRWLGFFFLQVDIDSHDALIRNHFSWCTFRSPETILEQWCHLQAQLLIISLLLAPGASPNHPSYGVVRLMWDGWFVGGSFDHINLSYFCDFPPHATFEEEKLHTTKISLCCANTIRSSSKSFIAMSLASTVADHFVFFETWGVAKWSTSPFFFTCFAPSTSAIKRWMWSVALFESPEASSRKGRSWKTWGNICYACFCRHSCKPCVCIVSNYLHVHHFSSYQSKSHTTYESIPHTVVVRVKRLIWSFEVFIPNIQSQTSRQKLKFINYSLFVIYTKYATHITVQLQWKPSPATAFCIHKHCAKASTFGLLQLQALQSNATHTNFCEIRHKQDTHSSFFSLRFGRRCAVARSFPVRNMYVQKPLGQKHPFDAFTISIPPMLYKSNLSLFTFQGNRQFTSTYLCSFFCVGPTRATRSWKRTASAYIRRARLRSYSQRQQPCKTSMDMSRLEKIKNK